MKKSQPMLSVIIPVYNAEKYLDDCLDSVVNQTYPNIEIICVNDGSTDNSPVILKQYEKKYDNIKVIEQENKGVNGARITGYQNANGIYIAWVDADDFVEPTMYEEMINIAILKNYDVVSCNYNFYPKETAKKVKWFREYKEVIDWKFVSKNTIQWNKIVKKELLDKLDIIQLFSTVGEGCYSIVLINAKSVYTINKCLYNYRVGHTSLSTNYHNIKWYQDTVERSYYKTEHFKNHNYSEEWQNFFAYTYLQHILHLLIVAAYNNKRNLYLQTRKQLKCEKLFSKKYEKYLRYNFSKIKLFVLQNIFMKNYFLSVVILKIVLR